MKEDILKSENVPVRQAAKYLNFSYLALYYALQQGTAPFGFAVKNPGGTYSYHISPGLLIAYKEGTLNIEIKKRASEEAETKNL